MFFLFELLWDPNGTNFAILQHSHHCFQCIESDILLFTQFSDHSPLLHIDKMIEILFILWCDNYAWPFGIRLVFDIAIATVELHCITVHTSTGWSHIHSGNFNGCHFFCMQESNPLSGHNGEVLQISIFQT